MGFNPFRHVRKDAFDLVLVAATVVLVIGLLAWAIWG
ncbi:hypothetical protein BH18ACT6_BH18ACT6_07240 [soil metagenome]